MPEHVQIKIPSTTQNPPTGTPEHVIPGQKHAPGMEFEGETELPLLPPTRIRSLPLDEKDRATTPIYTINLKLDQFNSADTRTIPIVSLSECIFSVPSILIDPHKYCWSNKKRSHYQV